MIVFLEEAHCASCMHFKLVDCTSAISSLGFDVAIPFSMHFSTLCAMLAH